MRYLFLLFISFSFLSANSGVLDVDWSSISKGVQQKPMAPFPKVLTKGVADVRLPVYLSKSLAYNKNMVVVADKNFYTISFELNGATVTFEGDRTFQESVAPTNSEFQKIAKKSAPVEYNLAEGIMSAEFNRHGVNYAISVECEEPKRDKRCKEATFIQKLYRGLIIVGGRP